MEPTSCSCASRRPRRSGRESSNKPNVSTERGKNNDTAGHSSACDSGSSSLPAALHACDKSAFDHGSRAVPDCACLGGGSRSRHQRSIPLGWAQQRHLFINRLSKLPDALQIQEGKSRCRLGDSGTPSPHPVGESVCILQTQCGRWAHKRTAPTKLDDIPRICRNVRRD